MNETEGMSLIVDKFRKGFRFRCPIQKRFYGPFFKTKESIEEFFNWFDSDIRFIGSWMADHKDWKELLDEWQKTDSGKQFIKDIIIKYDKRDRETIVLDEEKHVDLFSKIEQNIN